MTEATTLCGDCTKRRATGVDEAGFAVCDKCASRNRGYREGEGCGLSSSVAAVVQNALREGLPAARIREVVEDAIDEIERPSPLAAMTEAERMKLLESLLENPDEQPDDEGDEEHR